MCKCAFAPKFDAAAGLCSGLCSKINLVYEQPLNSLNGKNVLF